MKAITLWQPWASLLACGAKKYETRSWATRYRGPIAIHAALKNPCGNDIFCNLSEKMIIAAYKALGNVSFKYLPRGVIIATAELIGCWPMQEVNSFTRPMESDCTREVTVYPLNGEILFGDWTPGRYAWELDNIKLLDEPIATKGKQGLWNWEASQ